MEIIAQLRAKNSKKEGGDKVKKIVILMVLIGGLMANSSKAYALNPEKFGPRLIDGEEIVTIQKNHIYF